jgi:hypothetical protein
MITVGLVQELKFISDAFKTPISSIISCGVTTRPIIVKIQNGILEVNYGNDYIWKEDVSSAASMFGIESCDSIARIVYSIDNNIADWQKMCFFE